MIALIKWLELGLWSRTPSGICLWLIYTCTLKAIYSFSAKSRALSHVRLVDLLIWKLLSSSKHRGIAAKFFIICLLQAITSRIPLTISFKILFFWNVWLRVWLSASWIMRLIYWALNIFWPVIHCQQFSGTARIQDCCDVTYLTDDCLKRVLCSLISAFAYHAFLILCFEIKTGTSETKIVITRQNQHIIWQLSAFGTGHGLLLFARWHSVIDFGIRGTSVCVCTTHIIARLSVSVSRGRDSFIHHF